MPVNRVKKRARGAAARRSMRLRRVAFSVVVTLAAFTILYYFIIRPSGNISIVENGLGTIFTPIQNGVSSAVESIGKLFGRDEEEASAKDEVEKLRLENELLQIQINNYAELEQENVRLQTLLDAEEQYDTLNPVYAKVVAKDTGVWFDTFTINRGANDNISANMAVVNADGLIGRVYEVGYNYAKVLSLIDTRSAVACLIGRTRDNGVMKGQIDSSSATAECYMYYISNTANITPGDLVYTSGFDSRFPKGLLVGTVTAVSRTTEVTEKYVVVLPAVDFQHIEEVFVLRELVETDYEALPVVPTSTPRPMVTPKVTVASTIYAYATKKTVDENAGWRYPTATPAAGSLGGVTPTPAPTVMPPEGEWLNR